MVAISARRFRPNPFASAASRRWSFVEAQAPSAQLFTEDAVLLSEVLDHLRLAWFFCGIGGYVALGAELR
jgi:hypothetical protein